MQGYWFKAAIRACCEEELHDTPRLNNQPKCEQNWIECAYNVKVNVNPEEILKKNIADGQIMNNGLR